MTLPVPRSESVLNHLLFQENGTWYSGMVIQQYRFPALEIQSTDSRWEGGRILYVHRQPCTFVPENWLRKKLTVYGLHRELVSQSTLPPEEIIQLLGEREVLQENYHPPTIKS